MGQIKKINQDLLNKEYSAVELTTKYLNRLDKTSQLLGTYLTITKEVALKKAKEIDGKIAKGEAVSLLSGIPMGIKDNISTRGVKTTCASQILKDYQPVYNATVVDKLLDAGSVMLGKCNMDEFAMGSTSENSSFYPVKNPYALDHAPGGSSGGSAATVAAREVVFSLGSDTGGSVRQPASFCGVVGLKPTYGAVSRYGLISYASSLDQIGPLTTNVEDCAIVLDEIQGHDPLDSTSSQLEAKSNLGALTGEIKGLRIGVPKEYFAGDSVVMESIKAALKVYESLGAIVEETTLPHTEYALASYYIIASAECSSNLARFDGVRYGSRVEGAKDLTEMMFQTRGEYFGKEVKKRIMLGTYALSSGYYDAYYLKALKARRLLKEDFDQAFTKYDVLLAPVGPTLPYPLGAGAKDPMSMYLGDICTVTINLVGMPALAIPCGFSGGLPIGFQLIGAPFKESLLLNAGYAFEQATDYTSCEPKLEVE